MPAILMKTIWLLGSLSALVSSVSGYLLSLSAEYDADTVNWHMWMGISVTVVAILLFLNPTVYKIKFTYILSVLLAVLITITGHLGGTLTHGEGYLTGNTETITATVPVTKNITDVQEAKLYDDIVQPMLQTKCYSCHGPQKQKGKLRMDNPQFILKGGKNGEIILTGKADESEMIKRIFLPENDKKHMPPKQKPQLTEKETMLLHWWVQQGADFNKKVKEIEQPGKIKSVLLAMQAGNKTAVKDSVFIPAIPVEQADQKIIQSLKDRGVMILPVAANSNYLAVSFVSLTNITAQDLNWLAALQKQLVSLKIGNTNINDSTLVIIGKCSQLVFLQLNNTKITDDGMPLLSSLQNLRSLNIVGTNISSKGLEALQKQKSLQSVYMYQSKVTVADWPALKKMFPNTVLDSGGYSLQKLMTDTVFLKENINK